jgi:hypothetical protein
MIFCLGVLGGKRASCTCSPHFGNDGSHSSTRGHGNVSVFSVKRLRDQSVWRSRWVRYWSYRQAYLRSQALSRCPQKWSNMTKLWRPRDSVAKLNDSESPHFVHIIDLSLWDCLENHTAYPIPSTVSWHLMNKVCHRCFSVTTSMSLSANLMHVY